MDFLRCPNCNEVIFASATECRYCGRALTSVEVENGVRLYQAQIRQRQGPELNDMQDVKALLKRSKVSGSEVLDRVAAGNGTVYRRYGLLLLALIPMFFLLKAPTGEPDVLHRLASSVSKLPEQEQAKIKAAFSKDSQMTFDEVIMALPGHRIENAHLGRDSRQHWLYALISAVVFLGFLIFMFPSVAKPLDLTTAGLFTGTAGIFLLLGFQIAAAITQGIWLRGTGVITLLFYIVKFIGYSYTAALDPSNGFLLSCIGFTCGVGFCEEVCKMLPVLWRFRRGGELEWRYALLLGLASGAGFGVSEGITYASNYYNGIETVGIYGVRFISCVALHSMWSAATAITAFERQRLVKEPIKGAAGLAQYAFYLLTIVAVPMVLHGFYDTLLKKQMDVLALGVAFASFVWMSFKIERLFRLESRPTAPAVDTATISAT
jgi:RsiW-degrading membrane proteinase PrsW (M82 family)